MTACYGHQLVTRMGKTPFTREVEKEIVTLPRIINDSCQQ
jgi:hypothetical protein